MDGLRAAAYSLRETEEGWQWRVVDRDGALIEAGVARDQVSARAAIRQVRGQGAAPAAATQPPAWQTLIQALIGRRRRSRPPRV